MTHPNDMTAWPDISCQRGCVEHHSMPVEVVLGAAPHGYADLPQVPAELARTFAMYVWDPAVHPVDGGPYCPAHDAVSATIVSLGIWEPRETILALSVLESPEPGSVLDIGSQLGWYTLLAASCGRYVMALDAEDANLRLLDESLAANDWEHLVSVTHKRLTDDAPLLPDITGDRIRLAKLDIEGAEELAIDALWPYIEEGHLDFLMMECSPCFHAGYPELVQRIVDAGYRAFLLPPKRQPPWSLDHPEVDMAACRIDGVADLPGLVASWHQEDVWLAREGVAW